MQICYLLMLRGCNYMIKFENLVLPSAEQLNNIFKSMRNPLNSWDKSDSRSDARYNSFKLGENDKRLAMKLAKAGTDHRKFMRMMIICVDITAPLYWWKEYDTYKVGTVANSCSTMHTIHKKEITIDDFSIDNDEVHLYVDLIYDLNALREMYNETKDLKYFRQLVGLLPSSFNQKRTVMLNYEVVANIYKSRRGHKLKEWNDFCEWIETLPFSELIKVGVNNEQS